MPLFTVCIPAFNRASLLPALLDSVLHQEFHDFNVLICEDFSPERDAIRTVATAYAARYPGRLRYVENERNLGYDGNLRALVSLADGDYCLFMGNDDLMCPGALDKAASALSRHPNIGFLVRSYADFDGDPAQVNQKYQYFPDERFFPAGADAIATVFRRAVVISGMIIRRDGALKLATDRFDGGLLYQLWLAGNLLASMNAVFVPDILVLRRRGTPPDFGQAEAERGKFVPRDQTPESSLRFMSGMLEIAATVERETGTAVYRRIVTDIANYSYPVLSIQAGRPFGTFVGYWWRLARMGLGGYVLFHLYFLSLATLGAARMDGVIRFIKLRVGHTPGLGTISQGRTA